MSNAPSAGEVHPALPVALMPARLLQDGEVIILATKPSLWYVVLISWPVLAVAAMLPLLMRAAIEVFAVQGEVHLAEITTICAGAGLARLAVAMYQWTGRLYVLTNLRIMRIRGLASFDVFDCPLKKVARVTPSAMRVERMLGLGSLTFEIKGGDNDLAATAEHSWIHIARLEEVYTIVNETIRRLG